LTITVLTAPMPTSLKFRMYISGFTVREVNTKKYIHLYGVAMPCEKVSFAKKAVEQISHHRKDGVTEAWIESIVMDTPDRRRNYLKDSSFMIKVRTRKPSGAGINVFIYVRD